MSTEKFTNYFNIQYRDYLPSQEAYANNALESSRIALEGIKEFFLDALEKIKAFFKWLWEKFMDFIHWVFGNKEKQERALDIVEQKANTVVSGGVASESISLEDASFISAEFIHELFQFFRGFTGIISMAIGANITKKLTDNMVAEQIATAISQMDNAVKTDTIIQDLLKDVLKESPLLNDKYKNASKEELEEALDNYTDFLIDSKDKIEKQLRQIYGDETAKFRIKFSTREASFTSPDGTRKEVISLDKGQEQAIVNLRPEIEDAVVKNSRGYTKVNIGRLCLDSCPWLRKLLMSIEKFSQRKNEHSKTINEINNFIGKLGKIATYTGVVGYSVGNSVYNEHLVVLELSKMLMQDYVVNVGIEANKYFNGITRIFNKVLNTITGNT